MNEQENKSFVSGSESFSDAENKRRDALDRQYEKALLMWNHDKFKSEVKQSQLMHNFMKDYEGELAASANKKMLDLGCGIGNDVITLRKQGYEATGIDISHSALKLAEKRAAEEGVGGYFVQAAYSNLPYESNTFKVCYSVGGLGGNNLEYLKTSVKEVERVLENNGIFLFNANMVVNEKTLEDQQQGIIRYLEAPLVDKLIEGTSFKVEKFAQSEAEVAGHLLKRSKVVLRKL